MRPEKGQIAFSRAGHDKGQAFVITDCDGRYVYICDGKHRLLEKPKKKKLIHIALTNTVLGEGAIKTNRHIRKSLAVFISQKCSEEG